MWPIQEYQTIRACVKDAGVNRGDQGEKDCED
jgi:hypothetical protein